MASGGGPSVSRGTRFASGSSSVAAVSSTSVDGSTVAGSEGVAACTTIIIGAEKLSHIPRKRAIGRTACPGLNGVIGAGWQSVLCVRFVMFCEARLSMDCALSRNCKGNDAPPLVAQRPGYPTFAQNCERKSSPASEGRNSLKTRVSTRPLALTAFGRQWYRPSFPRKIFHVSSGRRISRC